MRKLSLTFYFLQMDIVFQILNQLIRTHIYIIILFIIKFLIQFLFYLKLFYIFTNFIIVLFKLLLYIHKL